MNWFGLNWTDLILNVFLFAVVPGLVGALGGHLAAEGLDDEKRRGKIKLIFWGMFAVWTLGTVWQQFRVSEADLARDTRSAWADAMALRSFLPNTAPPLFAYTKSSRFVEGHPDVTIKVVHPKNPGMMVFASRGIARDIVAYPLLFDLDKPDRNDSLYVSSAKYDWMKPGQGGGPTSLLHQNDLQNVVKQGDRIFGYISASCPRCGDRFYWVYFTFGEGGWYAEIEKGAPSPRKLSDALPGIRQNVGAFLATIPDSQRKAIVESEY